MNDGGWISELVRAVQQPRLAFGVLVGCGLCYLLSTIEGGLATSLAPARPWFAIGGAVAGALLTWDVGSSTLHSWRSRKRALDDLRKLTKGERKQLAYWVKEDIRSGRLDTDGTAASLVDRGLLVEVADSRANGMAVYVIPAHVWKHLHDHPLKDPD